MSTLLVTYDPDAGELLKAALLRAEGAVDWAQDLAQAERLFETADPVVLVVDTGYSELPSFLDRVRASRPWLRTYLLEEPGSRVTRSGLPVIPKPFDVAELAPLLLREEEAARLDRDRRRLEHRTGQLVEQQRDLTRELEHAERLAAIGRIAASMAHEINNPLAVIQSASTYVRAVAEQKGEQELLDCAADIELAIGRISTFVQHVCGFARRERPLLTDASLQGCVDIALRMVNPRARKREVELENRGISTLPVPHDPPRLAQAILNLLSNAVDAAATGGRHVSFSVEALADRMVVRVDDDGPGLADEIRHRLFEPFATTKPPGQGTGLGLAITYQIVSEHGGTVALSACPEHGGTRAELTLPLLNPTLHPLLVIDGDPLAQRALVSALRNERFLTDASPTPEDAARVIKHLPRVIVVDWDQTERLSASFVERLRSLFPGARLLGLVHSRDDLTRTLDGYLVKPWNVSQLISEVRRLCLLG